MNRCLLTVLKTPDLAKYGCKAQNVLRAVVEAAEHGLAIDGKLAYLVRFKDEHVFIPSYIGLVVVARFCGVIRDAEADVVYEGDYYEHERCDGGSRFVFRRPRFGQDRGKPIGAFARLIFPNGHWKVEEMDLAELERYRSYSKMKSGSIWNTHTDEMRKKTVLKRAMKLYAAHPALMDLMGREDVLEDDSEPVVQQPLPVGQQSLRHRQVGTMPIDDPLEMTTDPTSEQLMLEDLRSDWLGQVAQADSSHALDSVLRRLDDEQGRMPEPIYREVAAAAARKRAEITAEDS